MPLLQMAAILIRGSHCEYECLRDNFVVVYAHDKVDRSLMTEKLVAETMVGRSGGRSYCWFFFFFCLLFSLFLCRFSFSFSFFFFVVVVGFLLLLFCFSLFGGGGRGARDQGDSWGARGGVFRELGELTTFWLTSVSRCHIDYFISSRPALTPLWGMSLKGNSEWIGAQFFPHSDEETRTCLCVIRKHVQLWVAWKHGNGRSPVLE